MTGAKCKRNSVTKKATIQAKGITLIALVITIVILIILATVAVSFVFGEEGLISRAQQAAEMTEVQNIIEQMELAKAEVAMENGGKINAEDFFEKLEENGIIGSVENDVVDNGDGTYDVVTDDGYEFEVTVTPEGDIEIDYSGKGDGPRIRNINIAKTSNSVTITVETKNAEGGKFTYSYKKNSEGEESWQEVEVDTTSNTCTISNLEANEIYNIKVKLEADGETVERTINVQVGEMPVGKVNFESYVWQGDGTASIVINTTETGYTLQYQKVASGSSIQENNWTNINSGETITGLVYGDTVYGRLWDGTNESDYANATIEDKLPPQEATIQLSGTSTTTDETLTATVTLKDNESGVNATGSKWVYNTTSTNIGTNEASYTNNFTTNPEAITLQASTAGTYYLHVLTKDIAGNKVETISEVGVEVKLDPTEQVPTPIEEVTKGEELENTTKVEAPVDSDGENPEETGTIYVPGGFGIDEESPNDINDGIVISNADDSKQFVWIPVSNTQLADMYQETPTQLSTVTDMTPVTTDRYSKLRNEYDDGNSFYDTSENKPGTTRYREPDILPDTSNGDAKPENIATIKSVFASELAKYGVDTSSNPSDAQVLNAWAQMLVDEYNETYQSIATYGGFYIGRYEISGSVESPTVKQGGTVLVNEDWYNLKKACNNVVNNENAVSEMIYGNQWDRVMKWLVETGAKTQDEVYDNSSSWGNYKNYNIANPEHQITDAGTKVFPAGSSEYWCANNIYDLAGNAYDFTQEAGDTKARFRRGSYYYYASDFFPYAASGRWEAIPGGAINRDDSARAVLYVK